MTTETLKADMASLANLGPRASRTLASRQLSGGLWVVLAGRRADDGAIELVLETTTFRPPVAGRTLEVCLPANVRPDVWARRDGPAELARLVGGVNVCGVVIVA